MNQIKPTQITEIQPKRPNPNISLPRDLKSFVPSSDALDQLSGATASKLASSVNSIDLIDVEEQAPLDQIVPQTPVILSIKSQTIGFQPDGTSKVDVVLEIQDVDNAVEYEIRVAKNAGNL